MIRIRLQGNLGRDRLLQCTAGERLCDVLYRERVPIDSVLCLRQGEPVPENYIVCPDDQIDILLLEGYDLQSIQAVINSYPDYSNGDVCVKRNLIFTTSGSVENASHSFSSSAFLEWIEHTFVETVHQHELIREGDNFVLGFSGGIDSTCLLMLLARTSQRLPRFSLNAVTLVLDDDTKTELLAKYIKMAERNLPIRYEVISPSEAGRIFGLNKPLKEIFHELFETADAHRVIYIYHHVLRRTLEKVADRVNSRKIMLGLHASDIMGGLINAYVSGYEMGPMPRRTVGPYEYVYPLSFLTKKELALYLCLGSDYEIVLKSPDPWDVVPLDRNYFYALADYWQTLWPGIHNWLFSGFMRRLLRADEQEQFCQCVACGAWIRAVESVYQGEIVCDVCNLLKRHGYVR